MTRWPTPDPPGPGQESVWDYPRPPRLEEFRGSITIDLGGEQIAATDRGWRVLETSHQPIEPGMPLNGPTTRLVIQPP